MDWRCHRGCSVGSFSERVLVHAVGRLNDGMKFLDTYKVGEPMDFVVGSRTVLPTFERAVSQMAPGDKVTVHLAPEEGYGPYDESLVEEVPAEEFPGQTRRPEMSIIKFRHGSRFGV